MNENKPRKLVYVEKHTEPSQIWDCDETWYECPECGRRYTWESRTYGSNGRTDRFCRGCGNWMSWAKVDLENYKETDKGFDKKMPLWKFLEDPRYGHTWEHDVSMTYSQSEKDILEGCVALMHGLVEEFAEYLDFMDVKPSNEEERFEYHMSYFSIVQRLFLYRTNHSGGTSTRMKMANLGVDGDVIFKIDDDEHEED